MKRWAALEAALVLGLVASPSPGSDRFSGGLGVGIWRFSSPSSDFETVLDGSPSSVTVSIFGQYAAGPYLAGLRIGYVKKELPKGLRQSRSTGEQLVVDDPSSLRIVPVTLEFGLESRGRTSVRTEAGIGFAGLWHEFLPSGFVHEAAEDRRAVEPVLRLAAGVSTRWGRAALGVEFSYLTLLSAEEIVSKIDPEVLHGLAFEVRVGLR
jgi:hypothetical protein